MRRKKRAHSRRRQPETSRRQVRYAVVGLGYISQAAVLPAFEHAGNARLAALVSDDPVKLKRLGRQYKVERLCPYARFDELLRSGEIDAVYIALPNSLHCDYAVRAALAGIHVLCEKPMAVTESECERMLDAAREGHVRLMVAYRLHFDPANMEAVELVKSGKLGDPRIFSSVFTMQVRPGDIRVQSRLGGGTLYDIGIYCINASRYLFGDDPVEAFARSVGGADERFREVDEMSSATLRFPGDRLAQFTCSFGASDVSEYRIVGTKGWLRCEPAYEYLGELKHEWSVGNRRLRRTFAPRDQFAPELIHFSDCVLEGVDPEPSGMEGLADVRIIRALYLSAEAGRPVTIAPIARSQRPGRALEIRRPPVRQAKLVRVRASSL